MAANWSNPGPREVTTTVDFITTEAQKLHDGMGGPSQFDPGLVKFVPVPFQPYLQLAEVLRFSIPTILGIRHEGDSLQSWQSWEDLGEKINQTQTKYKDRTDGFWHRLWYTIGGAEDAINPWVALIPDDYGLAVVKAGLAMVFKLAGNSATKRQKIFDTFTGLRDAITRANPTERSFRVNRKVSDCADQLYQAVVDAIKDMIFLTSKDKTNWRNFVPKFKHKPPPPEPEDILQRVADSTNQFERALGIARDQAIECTQLASGYTATKVDYIHLDVVKYGEKFESAGAEIGKIESLVCNIGTDMGQLVDDTTYVRKGVDEHGVLLKKEHEKNDIWRQKFENSIEAILTGVSDKRDKIAAREHALHAQHEDKISARNQLFELLMASKKKDDEISRLKQKVHRNQKRTAVVSLDRFCRIIAQSGPFRHQPVDLQQLLEHSNKDLERALMHKSRFPTATQGQVQSLLRHNRFLQWMDCENADMILVDANIRSTGPGLSATSLFSATFVAGVIEVHPDTVVTCFFCSLHSFSRDHWQGPNGLIRSLIIQLLIKLLKLQILDLDFINHRDHLLTLEEHDLVSLCNTFWELLYRFPPDTTVFCIIDSISSFDKAATFKDLEIVLDWLQFIVEDRSLIPIFKVMMMNSMSSTKELKRTMNLQKYPGRLINLSSSNLVPMGISRQVVESHLLRPSTPTPPMRDQEVSRIMNRGSYNDEFDEGWQTD